MAPARPTKRWNPFQQAALEVYANGEYAYLKTMGDCPKSRQALAPEGLLPFLLAELEDVTDTRDALARLGMAAADVAVVKARICYGGPIA